MAVRAFFVLTMVMGFGVSTARPNFLGVAAKLLRFDERPTTPLAQANCQLCHLKPEGGSPWNSFGLAVGQQRAKKLPIERALYAAIALDEDADKDGYSDVLEIFAGTLPGDPLSKPNEASQALSARFEQAGGLMLYRSQ